jgi:diguanylate cyclase (GGDEF)-like protein
MKTVQRRSDALAISAISCEFSSSETESKFLQHHLADTQSQLSVSLIFCSLFYLGFALTDVAALGYSMPAFILFLARLAVASIAGAGIWMTFRQRNSIAVTRLSASAAEVVGMAVFMLVLAYRPDELHWHAMSMAIMLIVVYIHIPNRLIYSVTVALSATAVFLVLVFHLKRLTSSDTMTMAMLLLLTNAFGYVAARRYHRLWREEFRAQSALKTLSMHDHMTGCFNRRYLHEQLFGIEMAQGQHVNPCMTVIMCDLDYFKKVNDVHGHSAGDAVLRAFANLLKNSTRQHIDSVVRYGGEEFLIILPGTDLARGVLLAERLRIAFATTDTSANVNQTINATASFGVATVDFTLRTQTTMQCLISAADELLYQAKNSGRNQVKARQVA